MATPFPCRYLPAPWRSAFPSPADDFIEEEIDLQRLLIVNRPATFLVRVAGDSMVGKGLFKNDLAIVDRSLEPQNGHVVMIDVDGERSFKVWQRLGHRVSLAFAIPRYPASTFRQVPWWRFEELCRPALTPGGARNGDEPSHRVDRRQHLLLLPRTGF